MNEIERKFYDAWMEYHDNDGGWELDHHKVIGPYQLDFYIEDRFCRFAIEIDGHEAHKTKEQRSYDYKRERYLQKNKCIVVRFTGTEIFLEVSKCIEELLDVMAAFGDDKLDLMWCQELCFDNKLINRKHVSAKYE